jgi:hypothetical protein
MHKFIADRADTNEPPARSPTSSILMASKRSQSPLSSEPESPDMSLAYEVRSLPAGNQRAVCILPLLMDIFSDAARSRLRPQALTLQTRYLHLKFNPCPKKT